MRALAPGAALLPSRHVVGCEDRELFERMLGSFVPPGVFDFHAHLYPLAGTGFDFGGVATAGDGDVGVAAFCESSVAWMGDRAPVDGLFFGIPSSPRTDTGVSNEFVAGEVAGRPGSRALWLVRPTDDPGGTESAVLERGMAGFKVYHTFAGRTGTADAELDEYLPEWVWELADRYGLIVMVHLVRARALADEANQRALRRHLRRYPGARVVLAHGGRGFCAHHTVEGLEAVGEFENVYFDTSAVCDAATLLAIVQGVGASRLLYGSDYPVSVMRGRPVGVGDGFMWLTADNFDWSGSAYGRPTLVGIESLLALKCAARLGRLKDSDIESIFFANAKRLLTS